MLYVDASGTYYLQTAHTFILADELFISCPFNVRYKLRVSGPKPDI